MLCVLYALCDLRVSCPLLSAVCLLFVLCCQVSFGICSLLFAMFLTGVLCVACCLSFVCLRLCVVVLCVV